MRITILSRHYPEYCFRYANALARHANVQLILDNRGETLEWDLRKLPRHKNLTVAYRALSIKRGFGFSLLSALWLSIRYKPDLVHFEEIPDPLTPLMMLALKPFAKLVLTIHDPTPHSGADSDLGFFTRYLKPFGRWLADFYVVHGSFCERTLLELYPQYKGKVIRSAHGVVMVPLEKKNTREEKSLLFFGRMQKYKGLEILVKASKLLTQRNVDHKIIIAGRGPELDRLKDEIQSLPNTEVHNTFISPDQASELFQRCGLVVMPYLDATQSGVAAAAFGNGRPVIASAVGGLPDVVTNGENGFLVEAGNVEALANAIEKALADSSSLEKLSQGAKAAAQGPLNWDIITDHLYPEFSRRTS